MLQDGTTILVTGEDLTEHGNLRTLSGKTIKAVVNKSPRVLVDAAHAPHHSLPSLPINRLYSFPPFA